jgi:hypothetical protein
MMIRKARNSKIRLSVLEHETGIREFSEKWMKEIHR